MSISKVNPSMIILARESRKLRQSELAKKIGLAQGTISKIEKHGIDVSPEIIQKISSVLNYGLTFFEQPGVPVPMVLSYRRRINVAKSIITRIDAVVNVRRIVIQRLLSEMDISFSMVPVIECGKKNSPTDIARQLRKLWNITDGPIPNLTSLLERKKIVLLPVDFGTEYVLSRSILTDANHPIIAFNRMLLGDQLRFTLAYELGHLVMHTFCKVNSSRDIRHEANLFAIEFLMPQKVIINDLKKNDPEILWLGELKQKWGTSMQSLLYRYNDLGIINEGRKNRILTSFSRHGIKRREPKEFDVPLDAPKLLSEIVADYKKLYKLSDAEFIQKTGLTSDDISSMFM